MTNYATKGQNDKDLLEKIDSELAAGHAVLESVTATAPQETSTTTATSTATAKPKAKRNYLKLSDRMRIIDQFKHGIADPYYSVNPNPRKPGEYIVRKRKTPITYDLNTHVSAAAVPATNTNTTAPQQTTTAPQQTTTDNVTSADNTSDDKKSNIGVEFFSVLSSANASLQRELQSLTEKYNKLDNKLRKERAQRKNKQANKVKQNDTKNKSKTVTDNTTDNNTDNNDYEYEYEYEYPDEPNTQQVLQQLPQQIEQPTQFIPYIRRRQINIYDF